MSFLPAPHGRLECLLREPPAGRGVKDPVAVICHPHPQFGGTMHTKAVHATAAGLDRAGLAHLRFNFRGVGSSTGSYDDGVGEQEDVLAALDHMDSRFPKAPVLMIGFSFGSFVGLAVGVRDPRVVGLIALAPPFARYEFGFLRENTKPTLILQGETDDLAPLADCEREFEALRAPKAMCVFAGAGHLFLESLDQLSAVVADSLRRWPPRGERVTIK